MIYYVSTSRFSTTIRKLLSGIGSDARGLISYLSYEELFFESAGPIGHYIFTDFDRLSRYEMDCLGSFSAALRRAAPEVSILNDPMTVCERVQLLTRLHRAGFNSFEVYRLDTEERPSRYPVFLRAEDGYGGSELPIITDEAAYDAALLDLNARGLPLKGRIAVGFIGEQGTDGFYRKYGAFNIGGAIVPQHLMCSEFWVVKKNSALIGPAQVEEELSFVRDNPHQNELLKACTIGCIDFGRVDYGLFDGKVQIFEINTNPNFPKFGKVDARSERRGVIRTKFLDALNAINTPHSSGRIRFAAPQPRAHDRHIPRGRLLASLGRRIADTLIGRVKPPGEGSQ